MGKSPRITESITNWRIFEPGRWFIVKSNCISLSIQHAICYFKNQVDLCSGIIDIDALWSVMTWNDLPQSIWHFRLPQQHLKIPDQKGYCVPLLYWEMALQTLYFTNLYLLATLMLLLDFGVMHCFWNELVYQLWNVRFKWSLKFYLKFLYSVFW